MFLLCVVRAEILQLYLPASRVFSITQPIPFHIMFSSSAFSLAAYLPYGPMATILSPSRQFTRLKVIRQSIVDVRSVSLHKRTELTPAKTHHSEMR